MSKIIIKIYDIKDKSNLISIIKGITGDSFGNIKSNLENGRPIIDVELFTNRYAENALMLRKLMKEISENGSELKIWELPEGARIETYAQIDKCEISAEILTNILDAADQDVEQLNLL